MARVHPGAVLTPSFRDFLPPWVARQPWYGGNGVPSLTLAGCFRFEDPAGEVGVETHLAGDGLAVYQGPRTYRGTPMKGGGAAAALIATAGHSVLGTRWIYDGEADPVWRDAVLRLVREGGAADPGGNRGVAPVQAHGYLLIAEDLAAGRVSIEVRRLLIPGGHDPAVWPGTAGLMVGSWHPDGPGTPATSGCLAVLRKINLSSPASWERVISPGPRRSVPRRPRGTRSQQRLPWPLRPAHDPVPAVTGIGPRQLCLRRSCRCECRRQDWRVRLAVGAVA